MPRRSGPSTWQNLYPRLLSSGWAHRSVRQRSFSTSDTPIAEQPTPSCPCRQGREPCCATCVNTSCRSTYTSPKAGTDSRSCQRRGTCRKGSQGCRNPRHKRETSSGRLLRHRRTAIRKTRKNTFSSCQNVVLLFVFANIGIFFDISLFLN